MTVGCIWASQEDDGRACGPAAMCAELPFSTCGQETPMRGVRHPRGLVRQCGAFVLSLDTQRYIPRHCTISSLSSHVLGPVF